MTTLCAMCGKDVDVCLGSKPYDYCGADACTGFSPASGAGCCECGKASEDMGLVADEYLMCFDCMATVFEVDDGLYDAYDPAQADLTDLIVELEGLA